MNYIPKNLEDFPLEHLPAFSVCFLILLLDFVQFAAKICLLTSFRDTCFIEIVPQSQTPKRGKLRGMDMDTRHKYDTDVETCHFIWIRYVYYKIPF